MMRYKEIIISAASLTVLSVLMSGCAGMNGSFGCNAKAGDSCTPVSQINDQAISGHYLNGKNSKEQGGWAHVSWNEGAEANGSDVYFDGPIRTSEHIRRIWVAPYQDLSGNYHEPSTLYIVLDKAHWAGFPSTEMKAADTQQED